MTTRRTFLTANLAGATAWAAKARPAGLGQEGEARTKITAPSERDFWNDWPEYLTRQMNDARARRQGELAAIKTAALAQARAKRIRSKLWELIGGPLERTPLHSQITGRIDRGSYRIEKVIFESLPEVYVTANLYVPGAGNGPFPAVLAPLGHTEDGKAYRNYQYLYQNLARKGYIVLAFDPYGQGERLQYIDPATGRSRFGPTGEHSQAGRPLLLLGDTFALYRVWDGIRALDYLLSRPEADPARVGCTGHSGGGTMTMYLVALEPRLRAAVAVEANSENMAGPFYNPPGAVADAEQNMVGGLPFGIDRGDLLWAFLPKPLLVCYTTHDEGETYSPVYEQGTLEIYKNLVEAYTLFGAREKVDLFASHLPHDLDFFQRRATYEWFNRWLGNASAGIEEAEFDASPEGALNCTGTGQVLTSMGGRTVVQVNTDRAREMMPESPYATATPDRTEIRQNMRERLSGLLALRRERLPLRSRILSSNQRRHIVIEEIRFESEPDLRVMGWFVRQARGASTGRAVLYVSDAADRVVAEPSSLERVLDAGYAVYAISLRGSGITTPRLPGPGPRFYDDGHDIAERFAWASLALGNSVAGQRVWDVLRAIDYLAGRPDVSSSEIRILGSEASGLAALLAVGFDDRPRALLLDRVLLSYFSVVSSQDYSLPLAWFVPGILRKFDLPELVAALSPRPCWLLNAVGSQGEVLAESSIRQSYRQRLGDRAPFPGNLRLVIQPDQDAEQVYLEWLART
ncbi:MAG TPA: acetylxylan esterase [Terriglobia bacterium]|nr:acetylxylan esterase [Terriglobia bacterium]